MSLMLPRVLVLPILRLYNLMNFHNKKPPIRSELKVTCRMMRNVCKHYLAKLS